MFVYPFLRVKAPNVVNLPTAARCKPNRKFARTFISKLEAINYTRCCGVVFKFQNTHFMTFITPIIEQMAKKIKSPITG